MDSTDPRKEIIHLLEEATRHQNQGEFRDAERLAAEAKGVARTNIQACAEIDLFRAILLLEEGKRAEGTQNLSAMLLEYRDWFKSPEGRDVYEVAQLQRAFSLVASRKI